MSSSWLFWTTTRPCTLSSITVSPSVGAFRRRTGLTPAGASFGSRSRQGLWIACGPRGGRFSCFASSRSAAIASCIASSSAGVR